MAPCRPGQHLTAVAAAFVLSGLLIMLLPLSTSGPTGLDVPCGSSRGAAGLVGALLVRRRT
ncbi:hypothetical protein [Actinosynnema pretiosum]|uniref:Uncharacterized protein n=1 Tax=Actinosynnema pretiosum TaxID=42197 RepID=A0A290Z1Z8_9PSEU|nr:hypothetical protein [Actinosynnema pretiosum]ATE52995.1 hypothetical protein CNX65_06625 [Actinosynnema pretiosum]